MTRSLIFCLLSFLGMLETCYAAPHFKSEPLYGGEYVGSVKTPLALVLAPDHTCSGILVGKRLVLTAAHCVFSRYDITTYIVQISGKSFGVSEAYYNSGFDINAPVNDQYSSNDIAMIVLNSSVTHVSPFPIISDILPTRGQKALVFGFGHNDQGTKIGLSSLKVGEVIINNVNSGVIDANFDDTEVIVCAGDSGGALIQRVGNLGGIIGITSSSNSEEDGNFCSASSDAESTWVDLQSASSKNFLSYFPEVKTLSAHTVVFSVELESFQLTLVRAAKIRSKNKALQSVRALLEALPALYQKSDVGTQSLIKKLESQITLTTRAKTVATIRTRLKKANDTINKVFQVITG